MPLTKEEAENFYAELRAVPSEGWFRIRLCYVKDIINKYIEKPKREIQVGDIYKDDFENFVYIFNSSENQGLMGGTFYGQLIGKEEVRKYNQNGKCALFDFANLDLSKCYKLVEKENELPRM